MRYFLYIDHELVSEHEELSQNEIKKMLGKVNPANKPISFEDGYATKFRGRNTGNYLLKKIPTKELA